ncbi:MAG TPA: DEAD/DEAH box helicase family protein [Myxococcota bacterium]|nr:DEAD/DEAH box helicase family protein [Myxococcota bacterium]
MVIVRWNRGTLVLEGVSPQAMPPGFVWDDRVRRPRGEARLYHDTVLALHRAGTPYRDEARGWATLERPHTTPKTARSYQSEAFEAWREAGRRGVVSLPTGSGKSFVAELCIADTKRPTLVVAPTIDLCTQWQRNLAAAFGDPIGGLGGGQHALEDITVSTYDSAYIHMERYGDRFGLVVFDEVHHLPAQAYAQIAEMMLAPYRLGLSATVERQDGAHLDLASLVGPTIYEKGIKELSGHVLADYRVQRVTVEMGPDRQAEYDENMARYRGFIASRGIRLGGRNGWQRFLMEAARSKQGRAALRSHRETRRLMHATPAKLDALDQILEQHRGQRVIVFTNDNATVYRISRDFLVPCITHRTGTDERRRVLEAFSAGEYTVIATSRVLNEGVDIPEAQVGVVLSGSATVREHVQRLGRILRPFEGKEAVLYELVTEGTTEVRHSERRNEHDAYR